MDIAISYFYHVRNMTPDVLPVSTAIYDPKWFHDFKGQNHIFVDKKGVINGVKALVLAPCPATEGTCAGSDGEADGCNHNPSDCKFLKLYREQIEKINFNEFVSMLEGLPIRLKREINTVVLMVHEKYDNPCSERVVLQEWFRKNGRELKEWSAS